MTSHYDWKNGKQTCPCGWVGLGSDTALGETFRDGAEYHCPKCDHRFGFIAYPLLSESLIDPRAPQSDRTFAEIVTGKVTASDAAASIKGMARPYLRKLLAWLLVSFISTSLFGWISEWAGDLGGWEGQLVQFVFGLAGAVAFFTFIMFCVLIYGWLTTYKLAIRDSGRLTTDRETFLHLYRAVFGPIPWR